MICGCAAGNKFVFREGKSTLAVLANIAVVFKTRVLPVIGFPAEAGEMVLTVKRKAFLDGRLLHPVGAGGVPAIVGDRALISFLALFVAGAQLRALVFPGPDSGALTEKLLVAVGMLVAELSPGKPPTDPILAIH